MATVPTSVGLHDLPTPGGPCEVQFAFRIVLRVFNSVYRIFMRKSYI